MKRKAASYDCMIHLSFKTLLIFLGLSSSNAANVLDNRTDNTDQPYDTDEYIDEKDLDNDDANTDDEYGEEECYKDYNGDEEDTTINYEVPQPGNPDFEVEDYSMANPTVYDKPECGANLTQKS